MRSARAGGCRHPARASGGWLGSRPAPSSRLGPALPAKAAAEKFQLRKKNTQRSTAGTHALGSAPACAQPRTERGPGKGDCGTWRRLVPQVLPADTREYNIYFNVICFLRDSLGEGVWTRRRAKGGSGGVATTSSSFPSKPQRVRDVPRQGPSDRGTQGRARPRPEGQQ